MFPLFERYLLLRTVQPFTMALIIILAALMLERMIRLLDLLVNYSTPVTVLLAMLINLVPHYIGIALPAAFFVSLLSALTAMGNENELSAFNAGGISPAQIARPLIIFALILAILAIAISGIVGPRTRYGYRKLLHVVINTSIEGALSQRNRFTTVDGRMLYVDKWSMDESDQTGILLYQETEKGALTITAKRGRFFKIEEDETIILRLEEGRWLESSATWDSPTAVNFDSLDIPVTENTDEKAFRERGADEREMTLPELWRARDAPPEGVTKNQVISEFHGRLVRIMSIFILPLLAIPLARSAPRSGRRVAIGGGVVLLMAYHQILLLGENVVQAGDATPLAAIWTPYFSFTFFCLFLFYRAANRPIDSFSLSDIPGFDLLSERLAKIFRKPEGNK